MGNSNSCENKRNKLINNFDKREIALQLEVDDCKLELSTCKAELENCKLELGIREKELVKLKNKTEYHPKCQDKLALVEQQNNSLKRDLKKCDSDLKLCEKKLDFVEQKNDSLTTDLKEREYELGISMGKADDLEDKLTKYKQSTKKSGGKRRKTRKTRC